MLPFNEEQHRLLNNLTQFYEVWLSHARQLQFDLMHRLQWKTVAGRDYLYKIVDRKGNGTSMGVKSAALEAEFERYTRARNAAQDGLRGAKSRLAVAGSLYRALRLPVIATTAAAILREADVRGMLNGAILVVGTNALAAYELEAGARFAAGLDATEDFDLTWAGASTPTTFALQAPPDQGIFELLKAVDSTYTINMERPFQVRNKNAYAVEFLCAPKAEERLPKEEKLRPLALPSQAWLMTGTPVSQVVCGRDGSAARMVAPDPRLYALHKLWLSEQKNRERSKRGKDRAQGEILFKAIAAHMPHYKLNKAFARRLPAALLGYMPKTA